MPRYRKRPVEVEAFRLGHQPFPGWFSGALVARVHPSTSVSVRGSVVRSIAWEPGPPTAIKITISILEGDVTAHDGDWIIRGVAGELYPCKNDIFEATYEEVDDDAGA